MGVEPRNPVAMSMSCIEPPLPPAHDCLRGQIPGDHARLLFLGAVCVHGDKGRSLRGDSRARIVRAVCSRSCMGCRIGAECKLLDLVEMCRQKSRQVCQPRAGKALHITLRRKRFSGESGTRFGRGFDDPLRIGIIALDKEFVRVLRA